MGEEVAPRIPAAALDLVRAHQQHGDRVVLTAATDRFWTGPTAIQLGIAHGIATEPGRVDVVSTGTTTGVQNMCAGKVKRLLHAWLAERG